jgi:hypothetical protein
MKRFVGGITTLALASGFATNPAVAQLAGNPVYAITPSVGITLSPDYGRGLVTDESAKTDFFGGRLVVGLPAVSFWVGGGAYDNRTTGADMEITLGGGAAVNFLKTPSLPVALSLQMGGGTVPCGTDCSTINAYAGPALKINVVGAVNSVHPWVMPRVQFTHFSMSGASVNQVGFGGSGGINLTLPFGLGIHGAVDLAIFEEAISGAMIAEKRSPLVVGGGLHYSVSVPGFGVL